MNIRSFQYILEITRQKSFSRAADVLHVSQPALSKSVAAIEKELNVTLFNRNTTPISLTPAGAHVAAKAKAILQEYDGLLDRVHFLRKDQEHRLQVGTISYQNLYNFPYIFKEYVRRYPEIEFIFRSYHSISQLTDAYRRGEIDVALVLGRKPSEDFERLYFTSESCMLIVPDEYDILPNPCKTTRKVEYEHLTYFRNIPFVVLKENLPQRAHALLNCRKAGFQPKVLHECSSLYDIMTLVSAGLGVTITLSSTTRLNMPRENLNFYFINTDKVRRGLSALYNPEMEIPAQFVELVRQMHTNL